MLAMAALAWAPGQQSQSGQFRSSSDIVEVFVTATGRNGAGVHDLRGDEFELLEDGQRRDIAVFSTSVQPISVAIVLDHSGSTDAEFGHALQAAEEFVNRLFKEDRTRITTLGWDCVPFTSDRVAAVTALRKSMPRDPGSPIWSGTNRAMDALSAETRRRVVLLLSDGADNQAEMLNTTTRVQPARTPARSPSPSPSPVAPVANPKTDCTRADTSTLKTLRDVIDRAERETVMVYTVAVPLGGSAGGGVAFGAAAGGGAAWGSPAASQPLVDRNPHSDLAKLARQSGGSAQKLDDYAQLKSAFKIIADELHLQYLLGFVPSRFDGKRHQIDVRVRRPGVTIRAREAYVARIR